jgi:ABC-type transport system involved in cytochrome bd biosynthesis fused ATPase/permease subunit
MGGKLMAEQKTRKGLRFDWAYHFVTLPIAMIVFVGACTYLFRVIKAGEQISFGLLVFGFAFCLLFAVTLIRRYATKTQDRIVRMEEQFRHHRLTGRTLNPKLTLTQIIALRYAGDEEFPSLCEHAAAENLKPDEIQSTVKNWRMDTMRI